MNNDRSGSLICAVTGPIMLIAVGALFALDHMGVYSLWRTWPGLIIVLGVLKLLQRVGARPPQASSNVPGGNLP